MPMKDWSTTPSDNDTAGSINFAEGQLPSTVNNSARQLMADVRAQVDDLEWRDWGHTPTRTSNTTFTVPGDQTAIYNVGRRVRATDSSTLYGAITAVAYTTLTTVTVSLDSGTLSTLLTAVAVGVDASKVSIPFKAVTQPAAVANFVSGHAVYCHDNLPAQPTAFDIGANVAAAWESVGPTGSGAVNIWTNLDAVPLTAKALILKISNSVTGSTNADTYANNIYARKTGATSTPFANNRISRAQLTNRTGAAENDANETLSIVPVDSAIRFDLYRDTSGTAPTVLADAHLVGWIDSLV